MRRSSRIAYLLYVDNACVVLADNCLSYFYVCVGVCTLFGKYLGSDEYRYLNQIIAL